MKPTSPLGWLARLAFAFIVVLFVLYCVVPAVLLGG